MKNLKVGIPIVSCALVLVPAFGSAFTIASDFENGLDGWTNELGDGSTTWASSGGNPGGFVHFNDNFDAEWIVAPSKFLGDWSRFNGVGKVMFDHRLINIGQNAYEFLPYEVRISGPGGSAIWTGPKPSGPTGWLKFVIQLIPNLWTVTSGTWDGLLANVTDFRILIEKCRNNGLGEENGVDNVRLTDERTERVCPTSYNIMFGSLISGSLADLCDSDDRRMDFRNGSVFLITQSPITVQFSGNTTIADVTYVRLVCEYRVNLAGLTMRLDLFNQVSNRWDQLDERPAVLSDEVVSIDVLSGAADYAGPGGQIRAQLRVRDDTPAFLASWSCGVDQLYQDVSNK